MAPKAPKKPNSKKKWFIIAIAAALVAIIAIIIVIMVNKQTAPQIEVPGEPSNQIDDRTSEIDNIVVDAEFYVYGLEEAAAYAYLDEQIQKYNDDNDIKPRLIILKAYTAIRAGNKDKAIKITDTIDENSLNNEQKLMFYNLMQDIYNRNEEKYLEYYKKYYRLYDEMFDYVGDGEE